MANTPTTKFLQYVKNKTDKSFSGSESDANPMPPEEEMEDSSPMYDMACRLCKALGVDEEKAGEVADILHEHKTMEY